MRALRLTQFEARAAALAIARVPLPAVALGEGAPRARDLAAVEGALRSDCRNVAQVVTLDLLPLPTPWTPKEESDLGTTARPRSSWFVNGEARRSIGRIAAVVPNLGSAVAWSGRYCSSRAEWARQCRRSSR
jgi:hypothetical protein